MRVIKMNKELKQQIIDYIKLTTHPENIDLNVNHEEAHLLIEQLSRKRGRVKGKKYPRRTSSSSSPAEDAGVQCDLSDPDNMEIHASTEE